MVERFSVIREYKIIIGFIVYAFAGAVLLFCGNIIGSKHDLSVTNYYGSTGGSKEVCVFCHTPHGANSAEISDGPIWNRKITDITAFVLYSGQNAAPSDVSLACLSCHDGVSSEGVASAVDAYDGHNILNPPNGELGDPSCVACHQDGGQMPYKQWQIGPNLMDDHPVSIDYAASANNFLGQFKMTPDPELKLFGGKVECATCHNVHDPSLGMFLRKANSQSQLCLSCHIK